MSKGPNLDFTIKKLITEIHYEHPGYSAPEVRKELRDHIKDRKPYCYYGPNWPVESTVRNWLKKIPKPDYPDEIDPLDKPWNLLTLVDYDISPDALPSVMFIQAEAIKNNKEFTVREALWVARLHRFIKLINAKGTKDDRDKRYKAALEYQARVYARQEIVYNTLAEVGALPDNETEKWLFLTSDAFLYGVVTGDKEVHKIAITKLKELLPDFFSNELSGKEERLCLHTYPIMVTATELLESRKQKREKGVNNERSHNKKG
jgi:hypothetical protein